MEAGEQQRAHASLQQGGRLRCEVLTGRVEQWADVAMLLGLEHPRGQSGSIVERIASQRGPRELHVLRQAEGCWSCVSEASRAQEFRKVLLRRHAQCPSQVIYEEWPMRKGSLLQKPLFQGFCCPRRTKCQEKCPIIASVMEYLFDAAASRIGCM